MVVGVARILEVTWRCRRQFQPQVSESSWAATSEVPIQTTLGASIPLADPYAAAAAVAAALDNGIPIEPTV